MKRFIVETWEQAIEEMLTWGQFDSKDNAIKAAKDIGAKGRPVQVTDTKYERVDGTVGPHIIHEDNC